ncbi:trypsin-like serine peptidase [Pararhodobacter zhoushanensis]|uniref:Serine protease n=1 Tax=Pararhodobacter zhoushanensis TaxID=2479545 RepID=A0ABT3H0G0_9RHOB|nr:hypothetical protein [Pararhodobacter zhoushanensis]MCW1933277.1 hypothetical protein [Pararhodobacter zhoushanensis]
MSQPALAQVLSPPMGPSTMGDVDLAQIMATAIPMEQIYEGSGPMATARAVPPAADMGSGVPLIRPGTAGRAVRATIDESLYRELSESAPSANSNAPDTQDYGSGNRGTIYHYSDALQYPAPYFAPQRSVGKLYFMNGGLWYTCTATLIDRAILLTAGHCVYNPDRGGEEGWNTQGIFYPGYSGEMGVSQRYGSCEVLRWGTTTQWRNVASESEGLNGGYDVGMALCGRLTDARWTYVNNSLPGFRLGYLPFCYLNCRLDYNFLTQLGYPGNYYNGEEMTVGQHLEVTGQTIPLWGRIGLDYVYGSGMEGGSSGGPHILNMGEISDSARQASQMPSRNVVMAVTSWGYSGGDIKIQGASPLSGVSNANNFLELFNQFCRLSRRTHGSYTCTPLPT